MRPAPLFLLAGLLAGCALGPEYRRPATPTAEAYPEAGKGGAAIRAEWWRSFGDPELDALVARALAANTDLRAAVARVAEAGAVLGEVEGASLPQVDGAATSQQIKISEGGFNPNLALNGRVRTNQRAALATAFELDFWGRLRRAEEGARAQLLQAEEARRVVGLAVGAAVVRAYAGLRAAEVRAAAAAEIVAAREAEAALVARRAGVGAAGPAEVAAAEVARAEAVARRAWARRIRAQAEHLLGALTGQPALVIAPRSGDALRVPAPVAAGLPSDLLRRRPDVLAAEQALVAANARIGFVKAARFPTFSLTGALGTESPDLESLFGPRNSTSALGLGMQVPLFDAGRGAARVDAATAARDQAAAAYERAVLNAFREVRDALVDVRETAAAARAAERRAHAAREAFRVAEARQQAGQAGPAELLVARREQAESLAAVAEVRLERITAQVDLIRALGGARPDEPDKR
ncbi:MAG: efflux transporter outer membrane subunit [Verrucomicrobia bacterium]|nr:efflux transporter outer membrane subunit [Verrucomicrobiota bacterium]